MIKAYFFDWMKTLADATQGFNIKDLVGEEINNSLLLKKLEDVNLPNSKDQIYEVLTNARHSLYEDSERVITHLKPDYKLAIVSNMYSITTKQIKRLFPDFLSLFDTLTLSVEAGLMKPNPEIFAYTLRNLNKITGLNIQANEIMVIGDRKDYDFDPAIALGMQARLIDRKAQTLAEVI